MKKIFLLPMIVVAVLAACTQVPTVKPLDENAAKAELMKTMDSIDLAFKNKNLDAFMAFFDEKCMFYGTDPAEKWDKKTFQAEMQKMFADSLFVPESTIRNREIYFLDNGTAIAVAHFNPGYSKNIQVRNTSHFMLKGDKWICDFTSYGLIPLNKDLEKINQLVK